MKTSLDRSWKLKARTRALQTTADKYSITIKELKEVLKLAEEYLEAQLEAIDLKDDLYNGYTRIQVPGFRTYINVNKALIVKSMYEHGHITEEQWPSMEERFGKDIKRIEQNIKKYKVKDYERNVRRGKTV